MGLQKLNFMSIWCLIKLACCLSLIGCVQSFFIQCHTKVTFICKDYEGHSYSAVNLPDVLENKSFDREKVTAIYSYGFTQTPFMPSVRAVLDAYLANGDYNFMVISCDSIISYNIFNANQIADDITKSLLKMYEAGYDKFHLIGFSLGGQLAGLIGRKVENYSDGKYKIPRITGLDPGQMPPFSIGISIANLNENDANFVDVIHTETKYFGSSQAMGHANFWVNGGHSQPVCKNKIELFAAVCSHLMSPKYWAESVKQKGTDTFKAYKCTNYQELINKKCDESVTTSMGLYVDLESRGNFYLQSDLEPSGLL